MKIQFSCFKSSRARHKSNLKKQLKLCFSLQNRILISARICSVIEWQLNSIREDFKEKPN